MYIIAQTCKKMCAVYSESARSGLRDFVSEIFLFKTHHASLTKKKHEVLEQEIIKLFESYSK